MNDLDEEWLSFSNSTINEIQVLEKLYKDGTLTKEEFLKTKKFLTDKENKGENIDLNELKSEPIIKADYILNVQKDAGNKNWEKAESAIINAAKDKGLSYVVETGEAAFYGPKLDFMVKDALGRSWQLGTIQVDYNLPERFDLNYKGSDNELHRPVMIHRAPFGSMERFIAVLLEHTGGNFPLWLTPEQVIILPISEKYQKYTKKVLTLLENSEIRALVDNRSEKTGRKIRDAEVNKIPFMVIVGEKEEQDGTVSVRKHGEGDIGTFSIEEFVSLIQKEVSKVLVPFGN